MISLPQKGLMIAAPQSGSGKTVVTLALLRALNKRGIDVRSAKAGPDYIDPAFHAIASGAPSVNLDAWAMSAKRLGQLANNQGGSHLLIEAMMGLYDGAADGSGSGAELAGTLDTPVLLVIDAASQSHSVAALVRGFRDHGREIDVCGVIFNKVGSVRHELMLREALEAIGVPVVGVVKRSEKLKLPQRHLGLVQAGEISEIEEFIEGAAREIIAGCDLELLENCFKPIKSPKNETTACMAPPGQNIAIARDEAFSFIYPHLLNDWRSQGAQLSFFSPLADEGPCNDSDGVYLPGGYPELHGAKIAGGQNFALQMAKAKKRGALIYGECGGFMVLGSGLVDSEGKMHKMLGFLELETSFKKRQLHLGYRVVQAKGEFFAGASTNAHEFHYTSIIRQEGEPLFQASDALGENLGAQGLRDDNVMGSYMHLIDVRH
ncbi:MAG: cobyrinate a,c-diamide synthase [Rhizobiaceae bacterium]|nr:cobyrinate a,c-diamide synthase [Rhizobiaceae bacterium]